MYIKAAAGPAHAIRSILFHSFASGASPRPPAQNIIDYFSLKKRHIAIVMGAIILLKAK
jgi:hypothetical protein